MDVLFQNLQEAREIREAQAQWDSLSEQAIQGEHLIRNLELSDDLSVMISTVITLSNQDPKSIHLSLTSNEADQYDKESKSND
jgi:hypothetical protein